MATFYAFYPPSGGASSNPSIGSNGSTAPTSSTEVGGIGPDGNLHPISTDNSGVQNVNVVTSVLPTGAATSANQATMETTLTAIQANQTNGTQHTIVDSSALPAGAATSALQTTGNTSLGSIDTKTPALVSGRVPVDGSGVTQPISAAALPLPAGASTSALQTTGNTSLSSIDGKTPALGQALSAASVPVVLPATQITALTPPTTVTVTQATGTNLHTVVDSSALPSGAATSANQATEISSLATIATNTTGASTAALQTAGNASLTTLASTVSGGAQVTKIAGTLKANAPVQNQYGTTSITTGTYVQLIASTTSVTNSVHIFDSSGQAMILAVGASGSEVDQYYVQPGGDAFTLTIPAGSRVAYKALTATASSGYLLVNLLQ